MFFFRSEGREVEPPCDTVFKDFGNLYTGDPDGLPQILLRNPVRRIFTKGRPPVIAG